MENKYIGICLKGEVKLKGNDNPIGEIRYNSFGTPMKIVGYRRQGDLDVRFLDVHGFIKYHTTYTNFKKGQIRNPYDRTAHGIGFNGEGPYKTGGTAFDTKAFSIWYAIINRCYYEKNREKYPAYEKCFMCEDWMNYQKRLLEAILLGVDREGFTSNVGYFFLSVIPFLFFLRDKKILQYISLVYLLYYILVSMKRGAILIGFLSVLYFFYMRLKNSDRRERYVVIVSTVAIIVLSFYFIQSFYLSSEYFQMRLESTLSGSASNRQDFYPKLINYFFYNTSAIQFLLGSGADYTIRVIGNYAHNDWLEIAVNNGLLGLVLYLSLFITLWRNYMEGSLIMPEYIRNVLFVTLLIITLKTLFSMSYASFDVGIPICLGYCFAYISSKRNLLN